MHAVPESDPYRDLLQLLLAPDATRSQPSTLQKVRGHRIFTPESWNRLPSYCAVPPQQSAEQPDQKLEVLLMIVRSCMRTQVGREHTLSGWLGSSSTSPPLWLPQGYSISPAARSPDFPRYEEEPPPTRAAIARHSEGEQPSAVLSSMSTQSGSCTGRSLSLIHI